MRVSNQPDPTIVQLEGEASAKLNLPRAAGCGIYLSKSGQVIWVPSRVRHSELNGVGQVEAFSAELHVALFAKREVLE
jgi:hypothetical protein